MNRALEKALHQQYTSYLFSFEDGRIVIREPQYQGGLIVCALAGDPSDEKVILTADTIVTALNKANKK